MKGTTQEAAEEMRKAIKKYQKKAFADLFRKEDDGRINTPREGS